MVKKILMAFIIWRILLFLPVILAQTLLKFRSGYDYTSPNYFIDKSNPIGNFLLSAFANFDGVYYLIIPDRGYTLDTAGFFPLFPLIIKLTTGNLSAFDPRQFFIALILVCVFFVLALIFLFKLIRLDHRDNIAFLSIVFLLVFPTSFFFANIYSESLFLLLTVVSFYFARKRKWLISSILALLLTGTRFIGIAIIPALIFEFIKNEKGEARELLKKGWSIILTPLGLLGYMIFNHLQFGNAFQFIQAQGSLQNERSIDRLVPIPQTVARYINILFTVDPKIFEWKIALLEISIFIFAVIMLITAWRKKMRSSYIIFAALALFIPSSTGTLSGFPRYALVLFPIFIVLALIKKRWIKIAYSIVSVILLIILFMFFSKGYYIA